MAFFHLSMLATKDNLLLANFVEKANKFSCINVEKAEKMPEKRSNIAKQFSRLIEI